MKKCFERDIQEWEEREKKNKIKILKKWDFLEKRMKKDRGMWEIEEKSDVIERFKIDKAEDSLRRRMRLKRDYQASFKEYLSVAAFQEKMKSKASMQSMLSSGSGEKT
mmetsp:Transcript_30694/g.27884  ORF Transcript_30694/g.27884 Transcript_30694/m.27884 type:complete len:108 (+) Transcript_30694:79-402(+)